GLSVTASWARAPPARPATSTRAINPRRCSTFRSSSQSGEKSSPWKTRGHSNGSLFFTASRVGKQGGKSERCGPFLVSFPGTPPAGAADGGEDALEELTMRSFKELSEREVLALAISLEEEDARIYADFAEGLKVNYPTAAEQLRTMRGEE